MNSKNDDQSAPAPGEETLRAFAKGQLDKETEEQIAEILEDRPDLQSIVASMSSDDLVEQLKNVGEIEATIERADRQKFAEVNVDQTSDFAHENASSGGPPGKAGEHTLESKGQVLAGRYKLRENIGEGGMGSVWMAEQLEPVRRKVAVKLVKAGMDSRQVLARFEAERQALALMDHPNIAKILDGGVTDEGRPFFVMEYVKGVPFTEYCDEARVPLRERLELFIPVCQAIQHAHQKGIVHRDLKPSNVLICLYDSKPVPKVIDFGLAKALHQPLTENSIFTGHGMMVGTPLYMSPEQAELNNLDVDTRTDIYSLGVMLYELLTGTTPLEKAQFKQAAFNEILRLIKEVDPPRPSTRLSGSDTLPNVAAQRNIEPKQLCNILSGDLDWIVMKSLAKERSRRYETASSLGADVARYLSGEAVVARPPSWAYHLGKFVTRNRAVVATALLVVISLVSGLIGTSWFAYKAELARKESDRRAIEVTREKENVELQKARAETREKAAIDAVQRFGKVVSENRDLKNRPELKQLRDDLLASPISFFQSLRKQLQEDVETNPESLDRLGKVGIELAELTEAIGRIENALQAYNESARVWKQLSDDHPQNPDFKNALATTWQRIANLLSDTGRSEEAMSSLLDSVILSDELVAAYPKESKYQSNRAAIHFDIGRLLSKTGKSERALASHSKAKDLFQKLVDEYPNNLDFREGVALCQYGHAQVLQSTGKVDAALSSYKTALESFAKILEFDPGSEEFSKKLASCYQVVGGILTKPGTFEEAEQSLDRARTILESLVANNPSVTELQSQLAGVHWSLGLLYLPTHREKEALESYRKSLEIRERLVEEHPSVSSFLSALSSSYFMYGMHQHYRSPGQALIYYSKSRDLKKKLIAANPSVPGYARELAQLEMNVAVLYAQTNRQSKALEGFELAGQVLEKIVATNPSDDNSLQKLASNYENLGTLYRESGKLNDSIKCYDKALKTRIQLLEDNPNATIHQDGLAKCYSKMEISQRNLGKLDEAIDSNRKAIELLQVLVQKSPNVDAFRSRLAQRYNSTGTMLKDRKRYVDALVEFRKGEDILNRLLEKSPGAWGYFSQLGALLNNMAMAEMGLGKFEEAKLRLLSAIDWQTKAIAKDSDSLQNSRRFRRFADNHFKNLEKVANRLNDDNLLATARHGRAKLALEDPRFAEIEAKLNAVLKGEQANDASKCVELAMRAYSTMRYKSSSYLFDAALTRDPSLVNDRKKQHAYNAACAAALAAFDFGQEAFDESSIPQLKMQSKLAYQETSLKLLEGEIARWQDLLVADPQQRDLIANTMIHWQNDADLACVRDNKHLSKLPKERRAGFEKLWGRVQKLLNETKQ